MNLEAITHLWNYRPRKFRSDAFLFWSRGPDSYRKNDRKRAVVWPWLVLQLSTVLALTQLGIRQSDWRRAGIRSTNLHIVVECVFIRRIRLGNRYRTYFSVLTFSHSTGPGYQAVTWPRSLYPDRTKMTGHIESHRGRHCILVMWYTINGKCRCFLGVAFMFLAWLMHFIFLMMLPWWKQNFVPIAQNP